MSISSICTGDFITPYSIAESGWSSSITSTAGSAIECRIDTNSSRQDSSVGKNDDSASYMAYFASDPSFAIGKIAAWTKTGGANLATPKYLECVGHYTEGRPGKTQLWVVMFERATADGIAGVIE